MQPGVAPRKSSRTRSLEGALRQTHDMLAAARGEDWDRLIELEAERGTAIECAFAPPVPVDEVETLLELARRILVADKELIALSRKGSAVFLDELRKITRGRRASEAYRKVRRG